MALHLADSIGELVLRSWLERDQGGEPIMVHDHSHACAVLRRIADEAGGRCGMRQLVADHSLGLHMSGSDELIARLATLLVRGQLELVRLPYPLVLSEPVAAHELAPFVPELAEMSGIRERILVQGRLDAPGHGLDGELELEPPPELRSEHHKEPPPELDLGIEIVEFELEPMLEIEELELDLIICMGTTPRDGKGSSESEPKDGSTPPLAPFVPLGSNAKEPEFESGMRVPTLELDTELDVPPERET